MLAVLASDVQPGVAARANERRKLERLCRYITRPAVSERRLSLSAQGKVRYQLKTPYRDGTSHVIFEPLDLPGGAGSQTLTRYHGVFVSGSKNLKDSYWL